MLKINFLNNVFVSWRTGHGLVIRIIKAEPGYKSVRGNEDFYEAEFFGG